MFWVIKRIFWRARAWSTAIYWQPKLTLPPEGSPLKVFYRKGLLRLGDYDNTYADPFLIVDKGELFVFLEAKQFARPGRIIGFRTTDLRTFSPMGDVLKPNYHVSYPFVFRIGAEIFMVPETAEAGEVALYMFEPFPEKLKKIRVLLSGCYVDASPFNVDGTWYMYATSSRGLELFYTDDLVSGVMKTHPCSPVTSDRQFYRCAGGVIGIDGKLFRLAQNCSGDYGQNVSLMEIQEVTQKTYAESLARANCFQCKDYWNKLGVHHVSTSSMSGEVIVAVDGQVDDYLFYRLLGSAKNFFGRFLRIIFRQPSCDDELYRH